jgi:hypothetical protein
MEGYLKKWTNIVTRWKRRYFILTSNLLIYSNTKDAKELGRVYISTTSIQLTDKHIIVLETGLATLQLKASTDKETQDWFLALKHCKDTLEYHATEQEYSRNRFDSCADLIESQTYLQRLHSLYAKLEEEVDNFPEELKEHTQIFMELANEFRNTAFDSLNLLDEERKKDLDDKDEFMSVDEFEDAKSHATFFDDLKNRDLQLPFRDKLPVSRNPNQKINIWRVLKDTIGKDLSKMAVPVYFNEPLSFLQRFTEDLTYSSILIKASEEQDPCLRLALVCCFAVSGYAGSDERLMKPFNPLLGETFELEKDGFRVISEQVSHHPPISAIHCDHPEFVFYAYSRVNTSFKGTYLRVKPEGKFHLLLHRTKDHYIWEKPYTNVNNLVIGKVNVDHHGTILVENLETGHSTKVLFKKKSWFSKDFHQVSASITDLDGKEKFQISGQWSSSLKITNKITGEEIIGFQVKNPPSGHDFYYHFSEFAMQLNLPPEIISGVAPTDSRRRPDQRALENGEVELAAREKHRVEEKQRAARKIREEAKVEWKPVWFETDHEGDWVYKGGYWQAKHYQEFQRCPDIF